ncbi:hypothetical protein Tco_0929396 [Tanacetum coccineum]
MAAMCKECKWSSPGQIWPADSRSITSTVVEKYQAGMVESHGENVESHPHNKGLWSKVTPPNRGNPFGAYNASDHIFLLMGTPSTSNSGKESLLQPPIVRRSGEANESGGANRPAEENMAAMEKKAMGQSGQIGQLIQKHQLGLEKYQAGMVESHGENVESHPHNKGLWSKVTPPNRGNPFGAYNASDHIFLLMGTPSTSNASTSQPPMRFEKVS